MKRSDGPVVVEQLLAASPERVWLALTEIEQMLQWYFDNIPDFKPELGFKTDFVVKSGDREFLHLWEVTEVTPGKLIAYSWQYAKYPGKATARFELSESKLATKLTLTMLVHEDFPDDIPEFQRESCIGGWHYFLGERLKDYLEKS